MTTPVYGSPSLHKGSKNNPPSEKKRVLVAMSGGADSSVTAALLKSQGYDVVGAHLQLWDPAIPPSERFGGRCCSQVNAVEVQRVCAQIDIPYYLIHADGAFKEKVMDYFIHEFLQQRTPNPCVPCNSEIKFNYLFQKADELGCHFVATGHYAQVVLDAATQQAHLLKATDPQKDQTYFLFGMSQEALKRILLPLGNLTKMMVHKLATEFGLLTPPSSNPQEICFIGDESYKEFIEQRVAPALRPSGMIRTVEGAIVGEHNGLHCYTLGQKKGLRIQIKDPDQYFVVGFDLKNQALVVGQEKYLFHKELVAADVTWIRPMDQLRGIQCKARIRPNHEEATCRVTCFEGNRVHVEFEELQRAITPGQAVVFYQGDETIGGGFIDQPLSGIRPF